MQKKIGTLLEDSILEKAREEAHARHTTLNRIFEQALIEYLSKHTGTQKKISGVETSFGVLKLPPRIIKKIINEDIYEV